MDTGELAVLTSSAATSLVGAMVTDGWAQARHAVARLWSRVHPGHADQVADELDAARAELIAAGRQGDDQVREDLVAEWRSRLRRLLALDAQAGADLAEVVVLLQELAGDQASSGHRVTFGPVLQTGSGVVNQVGVGTIHPVSESSRQGKPTGTR